MHNLYTRETVAKLRQEELLREAQRRRLINAYNAGRTRATDRPSIQQRTLMAVRAMFQTVLIRSVG